MPDALLSHVAPLSRRHTDLVGDHLRGMDGDLGSDGFRPLRGASLVHGTTAAV